MTHGWQGSRWRNPARGGGHGQYRPPLSLSDAQRRLPGLLRWCRLGASKEEIQREVGSLLFAAQKVWGEGKKNQSRNMAFQVLHDIGREALPFIKEELERLKCEAGEFRVVIPRDIVAATRAAEKAEGCKDFVSAAGKLSFAVMRLREEIQKKKTLEAMFRDRASDRRALVKQET